MDETQMAKKIYIINMTKKRNGVDDVGPALAVFKTDFNWDIETLTSPEDAIAYAETRENENRVYVCDCRMRKHGSCGYNTMNVINFANEIFEREWDGKLPFGTSDFVVIEPYEELEKHAAVTALDLYDITHIRFVPQDVIKAVANAFDKIKNGQIRRPKKGLRYVPEFMRLERNLIYPIMLNCCLSTCLNLAEIRYDAENFIEQEQNNALLMAKKTPGKWHNMTLVGGLETCQNVHYQSAAEIFVAFVRKHGNRNLLKDNTGVIGSEYVAGPAGIRLICYPNTPQVEPGINSAQILLEQM